MKGFTSMKKITLLAIGALSVAVALSTTAAPSQSAKVYVCPPCGCADDTQAFNKPGKCPECGMTLIDEKVPPPTVAVLLFNGAQIIDYAGPWEAFGEAGFRVFTVSENTNPIHSVFGQKIRADYTFANSPPADVLLVPGGSINHATQNATLTKMGAEGGADFQVCDVGLHRCLHSCARRFARWIDGDHGERRDR